MQAKYRASAAHRWMSCPGSVDLEALMPQTTTREAQEGQRAHAELEKFVKGLVPLESLDDDLQIAAQFFNSLLWEARYVERLDIYSETFFRLSEDIGGTPDIALVDHDNKIGAIIDLKWGVGVNIEARDNPQMAVYACTLANAHQLQHVDVFVLQPRIGHAVKHWPMTLATLQRWSYKLTKAAESAAQNNHTYIPSESACRFCVACAICPALTNIGMNMLEQIQ